MKTLLLLPFMLGGLLPSLPAADTKPAATAINALGLDLYRQQPKTDANLLLSPYSIQTALAMTFAGADGDTKAEMQRVLHFPEKETALHESFATLAADLRRAASESIRRVEKAKQTGGPSTPIELNTANRLFVQKNFQLRPPFLETAKEHYLAPLEQLAFGEAETARKHINHWVEEQTRDKIRDLIPSGVLSAETRLVLANAVYLRAPWADPFLKSATKPAPFRIHGEDRRSVPTMANRGTYGYGLRAGFQVIGVPYDGGVLQFLIVLPNDPKGLPAVEARLSAELLALNKHLTPQLIDLYLPKFRIEPPSVSLAKNLQDLGLKTAFNLPPGSANFDRMAPRRPDDYLYISEVLHKAYLALDEEGTEAAAATAVASYSAGSLAPAAKPLEIRVDRPFFFAIQHVPSGACLFLGRVSDPR